jgi:hypothetical protein
MRRPHKIRFALRMLAAIHLDNQFGVAAKKISTIWADRNLTPKLRPA